MKIKTWLISWFVIVSVVLSILGYWVFRVDPYFHYHKPDLDRYYYSLNNQRSQNNGISRHFDYDAMITGTSMTENFRASEMDRIFGCSSIKTSFSGGSYKEINDNIVTALEANPNLKTIVRGLDMWRFCDAPDAMRNDLGEYPTYLYDNNPFNDVKYLLNRDVIFGRVYKMTTDNDAADFVPGITSFDDYSRWQSSYTFGIDTVLPDGVPAQESPAESKHLSEEQKADIRENIERNVTAAADSYPDVDFYYFYTPYSIAWWQEQYAKGTLNRQLEAERYITELILPHKNIHLFSFNNRTDIITDLNNYKDTTHYGSWINSLILQWMHDGTYQLTEDNYSEYLDKEAAFFTTYDFDAINGQTDYEADYYAGALLNKELTGAEPKNILASDDTDIQLNGADLVIDDAGQPSIVCHGTLSRESSVPLPLYIRDTEYIGAKFTLDLNKGYNYLSFDGQKLHDHGRLTAYVYSEDGQLVSAAEVNYPDLDNEIHPYVIDLSAASGTVTVILNGGYVDKTGSSSSEYCFNNIIAY